MTELYNTDKFYAAIVNEFKCNSNASIIEDLIKECEIKYHTKQNILTLQDVDNFIIDNESNYIWRILVILYGGTGLNPKYGWLYVSKELIDFLKGFLEDLNLDKKLEK